MSRLRAFLTKKKNRAALAGIAVALLTSYAALEPEKAKALVDAILTLIAN